MRVCLRGREEVRLVIRMAMVIVGMVTCESVTLWLLSLVETISRDDDLFSI